MEKIITYETLRRFAYCNDKLIKGSIRGIVVEFRGLNNTSINDKDPADSLEYSEMGIVHLIPYNNPWCWMNAQAVSYTDELIAALCDHYGLGADVRIVSTGNSMGGLCCLIYCAYARITPVACVANCPVCDMPYHITERVDLPRTIYSAYYDCEDFDQALKDHSPLHLVPTMPRVPYHIFHCEEDMAVNIDKHSARFVAAMRQAGFEVTYDTVPEAGHCKLTPEAWEKFDDFIIAELSK